MSDTSAAQVRMYGGWRRTRGLGIGSWSTGQSAVVIGAVAVPAILLYVSAPIALVAAGIAVIVAAVHVVPLPPAGDTPVQVVLKLARFARARAKGHTEYVGGVLTRHARKHDLPGPMASMVPLQTDDGRGGKQALLWDRRTGYLTAVLRCAPVGLELADQTQADQWVANWGAFLADLGNQPLIRWVSVTVDTAPAQGESLTEYVAQRRSPQAPAVASQIMDQLARSSSGRTADTACWVSITCDPARAHPKPRDLLASCAEVTRWLPGWEQALSGAGVTVLGRASVPWLVSRLAAAFDPAQRAATSEQQEMLAWRDAAPLRAREHPDRYEHASGTSVSWALRRPPQQAVTERTLRPLLSPGPFARRLTILYEPMPAEDASDALQREITSVELRHAVARKTKRDITQREIDDQRRAQQAALEEARGAGVLDWTVFVTTTVTVEEQLPAAIADTEQRAATAKPLFRQVRHAQCAGFDAAMGMGINPADLERARG